MRDIRPAVSSLEEPEIAAINLHAEISLHVRATSVDPLSLLANGSISSPGETFSTALLYRPGWCPAKRTIALSNAGVEAASNH